MRKANLGTVALIAIVLMVGGCSYFGSQFTEVETDVAYVPGGDVYVSTPTVGNVLGQMIAPDGPRVFWHTSGRDYRDHRDYEDSPQVFDLNDLRLSNGGFRRGIRMSVVPMGVTRAISVIPSGHTERISGPTERSGWAWTTPNHYDGATRCYKLQIQYQGNTKYVYEFEYWVISSTNGAVTSEY